LPPQIQCATKTKQNTVAIALGVTFTVLFVFGVGGFLVWKFRSKLPWRRNSNSFGYGRVSTTLDEELLVERDATPLEESEIERDLDKF